MATELFCWGYTAYLSGTEGAYCAAGYIDGKRYVVVKETHGAAERAFCRAAVRGWMRRRLRSAIGLTPRKGHSTDSADTYVDVTTVIIAKALLHEIAKILNPR